MNHLRTDLYANSREGVNLVLGVAVEVVDRVLGLVVQVLYHQFVRRVAEYIKAHVIFLLVLVTSVGSMDT